MLTSIIGIFKQVDIVLFQEMKLTAKLAQTFVLGAVMMGTMFIYCGFGSLIIEKVWNYFQLLAFEITTVGAIISLCKRTLS